MVDSLLVDLDLLLQLCYHVDRMSLGLHPDRLLVLDFLQVLDLMLALLNSMVNSLHMMDSGLQFSLLNSTDLLSRLMDLHF